MSCWRVPQGRMGDDFFQSEEVRAKWSRQVGQRSKYLYSCSLIWTSVSCFSHVWISTLTFSSYIFNSSYLTLFYLLHCNTLSDHKSVNHNVGESWGSLCPGPWQLWEKHLSWINFDSKYHMENVKHILS